MSKPGRIRSGEVWPDEKGLHVNAHGGGVIFDQGRYYWFGEHKREGFGGRLAYDGVHGYSSDDLCHWKDEGLVLKVVDDPASPIHAGCRIERPKVLRCPTTGKYVMWFHSTDVDHRLARSGVAVADRVTGPYVFLRAFRPDAGVWPMNLEVGQMGADSIARAVAVGEYSLSNGENALTPQLNILGRDFAAGQMARDMTLFQDDDGRAYHLFASEQNSTLHIAELSDDYLDHSGRYVRVFPHRWMEAPALFKSRGRYYLLMSGCTSWDPNEARSAVADSIWGPWRELGNPCEGVNPTNGHGAATTFGCQSSFVLKVSGKEDSYIAMLDQWNPQNFIDSRYVWLPVSLQADRFRIIWRDAWEVTV
jgi:hypothetical protein